MYKIEFYENQHGESDVWDFLETLRIKSTTNKKVERDDYIRQKEEEQ